MASVFLCGPTNSTMFTTCCEVAICDDQGACPRCGQSIDPGLSATEQERRRNRWRVAYTERGRIGAYGNWWPNSALPGWWRGRKVEDVPCKLGPCTQRTACFIAGRCTWAGLNAIGVMREHRVSNETLECLDCGLTFAQANEHGNRPCQRGLWPLDVLVPPRAIPNRSGELA